MDLENDMHESKDKRFIPMTSITNGTGDEAAIDVAYYTDQIVNVSFIGYPEDGDWFLIDAGLPYSEDEIRSVSTGRFGKERKPKAIILTHGHFDHVGGLIELVRKWEVPVYAHPMEMPYLTGKKSYPVPDGSVEGGMLAKMSPMYPNEPIDLGEAVHPLPDDGSIPGLPEWQWLHTPGHSPGHVSFFRDSDKLLLSGDAFITVKQDSFYNVLTQEAKVSGPPNYLTTDWDAAYESVKKLAALEPKKVVPGHGVMMKDEDLEKGLNNLINHFDEMAVPAYGRFVEGNQEH